MSDQICHRVLRAISDRPICMEPKAFRIAIEGISPRLGLTAPQASADPDSFAAKKRAAALERLSTIVEAEPVDVGDGMCEYGRTKEGVAVVSIVGTLMNRYDWLAAWCGFMSYDTISLAVNAAVADQAVKAILLDVDSPGGEAAGMLDCADVIRAASKIKPVWGNANTLAASAGFGLAAAAERLTVPRLGTVGSVGVVGIHVDQSGYDKEMGLKYTPIYSGARKIDGWGHAPLARDALERIQARFDESRRKFADAIGKFRGLTLETVLGTEADVFDDDAAVEVGFADAVASFDETLAELTTRVTKSDQSRSISFAQSNPKKETTMAGKPKAAATAASEATEAQTTEQQPAETEQQPAEQPAAAPEKPADQGEKTDAAAAKADPAAVAEYCAANGAANLAAELIRSGATMDQVKERVGRVGEINRLTAEARKVCANIDSGFEKTAIDKGMSVEEVRKALFDKLVANQSPEIRSAIPGDQKGEPKAAGSLDTAHIYASRAKQVEKTAAGKTK